MLVDPHPGNNEVLIGTEQMSEGTGIQVLATPDL